MSYEKTRLHQYNRETNVNLVSETFWEANYFSHLLDHFHNFLHKISSWNNGTLQLDLVLVFVSVRDDEAPGHSVTTVWECVIKVDVSRRNVDSNCHFKHQWTTHLEGWSVSVIIHLKISFGWTSCHNLKSFLRY